MGEYDRAHQLDDDGGADIGHDAQGEDGGALQGAAHEGVVQAEQVVAVLAEELRDGDAVDAGKGHEAPQAVNREDPQGEEDLVPEVLDLPDIQESLHRGHFR